MLFCLGTAVVHNAGVLYGTAEMAKNVCLSIESVAPTLLEDCAERFTNELYCTDLQVFQQDKNGFEFFFINT